jgi:hypothetical protein
MDGKSSLLHSKKIAARSDFMGDQAINSLNMKCMRLNLPPREGE